MTDKEVFKKYDREWERRDDCEAWYDIICEMPTDHLIQHIRYELDCGESLNWVGDEVDELRLRTDIPKDLELEVLLLTGR